MSEKSFRGTDDCLTWMELAQSYTDGDPRAQRILDALVDRADQDGVVRPDGDLIDQTFDRRDAGEVLDLRSASISVATFLYVDTELWLSAATGIPLDDVDRVIGSLQPGRYDLIDFVEIPGDPLQGTAELVVRKQKGHPVERVFETLASDAQLSTLPSLGDSSSRALPGTGWIRDADEYRRPPGSVALVTLQEARATHVNNHVDLDLRSVFWMGIRGIDYHRAALPRQLSREPVWLELVPEPHNPHDSDAVALDLDGVRIGYVGASVAYRVHPVVRYQNLDGKACFVPGVLHGWDSAYVALPTQSRLEQFINRAQIAREVDAVWEALPATVRDEIESANFWLNEVTAAAVASARHFAPHADIPERPTHQQMPAAWDDLMREKRRVRRERRAAERLQEREATARRVAGRDLERTQRDARIVELHRGGRSRTAIAHELGIASSTVTKALAAVGVHETGGMNDYSRAAQEARIERCRHALELQRSGLSRAEIALAMRLSSDTVRLLLRDGRFYESPESNRDRLDLAVLANHHGWTRAALDAEDVQAKRAVTDAHVLELLRPDLLER